MLIPMNWIRQYTQIPDNAETYVNRMIMTGTAVEGYEEIGGEITNVVVGRVISMERHPDSDHLWVCQIDVGGDHPLQIVTGAQNLHGGELVPVCLDGATLPGGHTIKTGKLRGVPSEGMLCSGQELGVDEGLYPGAGVNGILVFNEEHPLGSDVKPIFGFGDTVIDFDILANRPDCLSVWGIARESSAAFESGFTLPSLHYDEKGGDISQEVSIEVCDDDLCPRYDARVIKNVRIGPSPEWLKSFLHATGMRSINNIVDITNFVMLETGHPMHAFDLARVRGRKIIVRRAADEEILRTLDGKEHKLNSDMLVIADAEKATGLAGIMGGEESEITEETREVLFECAAFDRANIRVTSRALGIRTDASGHFEKGVSPATVPQALDRACALVQMLDAGDVVSGCIDLCPNPPVRNVIKTSVDRICKWTGVSIPANDIVSILRRLHFDVTLDGDQITAAVPEFRQDVDGFADLAEEALRYYGFDHLPSSPLEGMTTPGFRSDAMKLTDQVKNLLVGLGGHESMTFSFISPSWLSRLKLSEGDPRLTPVVIRNPLGDDTSVMRTTLVPSMLQVLSLNINRKNQDAFLFETGVVFEGYDRPAGSLPKEMPTLCIGAYGKSFDFYSIRGIVEEVFRVFGVSAHLKAGADVYYHPGRSASLTVGDQQVARFGEIHPDVMDAFDISERVYLAEIDLALLFSFRKGLDSLKALPRFPEVTRDLALVIDESVPVGPVLEAIKKAGGPLMDRVEMFDIYRGDRIGAGKKSVAFSLHMRAEDKTLTDDEANKIFDKALRSCERQFGAELRG